MKVKVINISNNLLPLYQTKGSAGMDLYANIGEDIIVPPNGKAVIPTGLMVEIPIGYYFEVCGRSGLLFKYGVKGYDGVIDSDFRGEIKAYLHNISDEPFTVKNGERISQMILKKYETIEWEQVTELSDTERGTGGFGSTGL